MFRYKFFVKFFADFINDSVYETFIIIYVEEFEWTFKADKLKYIWTKLINMIKSLLTKFGYISPK